MSQQDISTKKYVNCWHSYVLYDLTAITTSFLWCFRMMVFIYSGMSWESELHAEELNPFTHWSVLVNKARWRKLQLLIGMVWLLQKELFSHSFWRFIEVPGWCKCNECARAFHTLPEFRTKPTIIALPMQMIYQCNFQVLTLVELLIKFFPTYKFLKWAAKYF